MDGARRPVTTGTVSVSVHNEGPDPVDVEVFVHGDHVSGRSLHLGVAATETVPAPAGVPVEVHTPAGTATSVAARGVLFVCRDRGVLVATD